MNPQVEVTVELPEGTKAIAVCDYDKFKASVEHLKTVYPEVYEDLQSNFQFNLGVYQITDED